MVDTNISKAPLEALPIINASTVAIVQGTGYTFKNYYYAITSISQTANGDNYKIYADLGCIISIIDSEFVPKNTKIRTITTSIPIRGLGTELYQSNQFTTIDFYIKGQLGTQLAIVRITREVYVVKDLKARMLIGVDIITPEDIALDFAKQRITIGSYQDIVV